MFTTRLTRKIFGIGLPKTGTMSLQSALNRLGFHCLHSPHEQTKAIDENAESTRRPLQPLDEEYDGFIDLPIPFEFAKLDRAYPGSRFIWTTRDFDEWLDSWRRHVEKNAADPNYQGPNNRYDEAGCRRIYTQHARSVHEYFAGRDDLLQINICRGEGWDKLCRFLGHMVMTVPFPHENKDNCRDATTDEETTQGDRHEAGEGTGQAG